MLRRLAPHALNAVKRLFVLYREAGFLIGLTIVMAGLDDRYLKRFDRRYGIHTTGFIDLHQTSFERSRLRNATNYGPINGWAFRRLLRDLDLPRGLHFADLGCGMGRACIVAAEYGFARVTGVELAPEFCLTARENIANCHPPAGKLSPIVILQMDVLDYCDQSEDDVFFMYRPFSEDFLKRVLAALAERARAREKSLVVIYAERAAKPENFSRVLTEHHAFRKVCEVDSWGQAFWVYRTANTVAS